MTAVRCSVCGYSFEDFAAALREAGRSPCPICGNSNRTAFLELHDTASAHESMGLKARDVAGGRPFLEAVHDKLEWFRKLGRWHQVTRIVNRRDDEYHEVSVDGLTGEVVREVHEPLSQHRGHGSARSR